MSQLFQNHTFKVAAGLIVGLAAIMYFDPPGTPCTAQVEVYREGLKGLTKNFGSSLRSCREHPEPGGCIEFFDVLSKIESRFNEVSHQCQEELVHDTITQSWITTSMEVFTRVAWGSVPPASYIYRSGWLDSNQVLEFCRLKKHLETIYGEDVWASFVSGVLGDLPGSQAINSTNPNEAWNRSLLSDPCQYTF
jgi:hypothetical protein